MEVTKKIKYTSPIVDLILALLMFGGGVFLLVADAVIGATVLVYVVCILIAVYGVSELIRLQQERELKQGIGALILYLLLAVLLLFVSDTDLFRGLLNLVLAALAFILFIIRVMIGVHIIRNGSAGFFRNTVSALICLFFVLALVFYSPKDKLDFCMFMTAVYLICMGVTLFGDFLAELIGSDLDPKRTGRRVHFAMPNAITATMTAQLIDTCNEYAAKHPEQTRYIEEQEGEDPSKINFELLLHVSRKKGKMFGHVDVAIGDKVYTYGCYDDRTSHLGGFVAGGVFVILPRDPYIRLCLTKQEKYLIAYGCVLSDDQMNAVQERIAEIMTEVEPITDLDMSKAGSEEDEGVISYAALGGKPYRVVRGPFKTYLAVASNCVKLADTIIGKAGIDRITGGNLVTPGSYLCMMDNLFYRKGTRVIRRAVYLKPEE